MNANQQSDDIIDLEEYALCRSQAAKGETLSYSGGPGTLRC